MKVLIFVPMKKILICGVLSTCFLATVTAQTVVLDEDFQQGIPGGWTIVVNDTNTLDPSVIEFAPGWISLADPDNTTDTVAGANSITDGSSVLVSFTTMVQPPGIPCWKSSSRTTVCAVTVAKKQVLKTPQIRIFFIGTKIRTFMYVKRENFLNRVSID